MSFEIPQQYLELRRKAEEEANDEVYTLCDMEKLSRRLFQFLESLEEEDRKKASLNIAQLIYSNFFYEGGKNRTVPYKGKYESEYKEINFDLKNIPPLLAKIISLYLETVF